MGSESLQSSNNYCYTICTVLFTIATMDYTPYLSFLTGKTFTQYNSVVVRICAYSLRFLDSLWTREDD